MDGVETSLVSWHTVPLRQTACRGRSHFPFYVNAQSCFASVLIVGYITSIFASVFPLY